MTEAYDLRSNIKGKAGSQGTLFQVKDKGLLNPDQRWPKGYTPERQAEVKGALADVPVQGRHEADGPHQRARVEDTVARSTIPVEHLKGLKSIDANMQDGSLGTYWPHRNHLAVDMLNRDQWHNDDVGQTLIHELGHHRDATSTYHTSGTQVPEEVQKQRVAETADRINQSNKFPKPEGPNGSMRISAAVQVTAGLHEGYADNYVEEHYRTPGRNPQPVTQGPYEKHFSPEQRDIQYPGYHDIRPPKTSHMGPQFDQAKLF